MRPSSKRLALGLALLLGGCAGDGDPAILTPQGTSPSEPGSAPAVLAIRVLTAGIELDVDGYTIDVANTAWSVAANDSLTIADLLAGDYLIRLGEVAGNCATVDGLDLRAITLSSGTTTSVQFNVLCASTAVPDTAGPAISNAPACYLNGTGCSLNQLEQWKEAEEARIAATQQASQTVYDSLEVVWDTYLRDFPLGQSQFLMCGPLEYEANVRIVGPQGADMSIGPHELHIPPGALSESVVITGEMPVSLLVSVELSPHGLQFAPGVTLVLSYKHCEQLESYEYLVAYLDANRNVLEWPTSRNYSEYEEITADIDHFSKYAVAY